MATDRLTPPTDLALTRYDAAVPASVIVVNWNGREHLDVCLGSLLRQTLPGVEIVLVDNASTDDSLAFVRERFGDAVHVVAQPENRGYAGGLNAGIAAARGRYLLPLNSDTEVAAECCARLVVAADAHPNTGMFAPKILEFDERDVASTTSATGSTPTASAAGAAGWRSTAASTTAEEEIVLPSGCAVLLRRAMLADVGLFDEDLFAYCDDTDLGLRARLAGWRCRSRAGRGRLPQVLGRQRRLLAAEGVPGRAQPRLGRDEVPAGAAARRQPALHRSPASVPRRAAP